MPAKMNEIDDTPIQQMAAIQRKIQNTKLIHFTVGQADNIPKLIVAALLISMI